MKNFVVYILASIQRVLYIGMTSDLEKRLWEHRTKKYSRSFTSRYNVTKLVHLEIYDRFDQAERRETELKGWRRSKKVRLIERFNPEWEDLAPPTAQVPRLRSG